MTGTYTTTSAVEAAQLLLQRRSARRDLAEWCRLCGYEPAAHHQLLLDKLTSVTKGEINRLAIFMPPGSAKSTYASVLFPPWFLAQEHNPSILAASHSADLAKFFGRRARNLVMEHEKVLEFGLRDDSQAADEWTTTKGGLFFCAGVGGRIAGRRARLGLIDDPVGSKEDAYSKVVRDATWDWYNFDFRTRLLPDAAVVLIQTRWHEDDLAGRILATEGKDWEVINLPFLADEDDPLGRQPGEMLWPEFFNQSTLESAKKNRAVFSALYQQKPVPEDGDYFRRSWVENNSYGEGELPDKECLTVYAASDHAVSEKQEADSTCFVIGGLDNAGVFWVFPDIFWEKCDTLVMVEAMLALMKRHSIRTWWAEGEHISKSIGPFLRRRQKETSTFCYVEEVRPSRDKQTRAQSIRGRFQVGMVRLPRFAPWYNRALEQMLKFPAGLHDDFIDPLGLIGLGLDKMVQGSPPSVVVDPSFYLKPTRMTLKWLKDEGRRKESRQRLLALDN